MTPPLPFAAVAAALAVVASAAAQPTLPPEPVRLDSPAAFQPLPANWSLAGGLGGDPRRDRTLTPLEGTGILVCNPGREPERRGHLFTAWEHGDLELELEFLLTPGSNSGVYLQGRYEVQLFDSWGRREVGPGDSGGIYSRWDAARGKGREAYDGHAPAANASRAPGLWQRLRIEFQAPRFDAAGKKVRHARFTRVVLNGFTIHSDVEISGPTRSAAFADERPAGPLMIQGDHGSVALRGLRVKRFDGAILAVSDLRYRLYPGDHKSIAAYDRDAPAREGVAARFAHEAIEKSVRFALVFTGALEAPRAGAYRFAVEASGPARLTVDDRPVVVPVDRTTQPGVVHLAAGRHPFRLDLVHSSNARPNLELVAEGPGIAPHFLTVREPRATRTAPAPKRVRVEPGDRVAVQRGFVPFNPRKRLDAASVGTPAGVHFAYDFETGSILRAWRGPFLNTADMWEGRGADQTARPEGPALTFDGRPALALIEYPGVGDWPDRPEPLWSSQGYSLEPDGTPVFLGRLADLTVRDRIAPAPEGRGLVRTLELGGKLPSWSAWLLLAEADVIVPQPGGGWMVGDRAWYIDGLEPAVIRAAGDRQQLALPLSAASLGRSLSYTIVW